MSYYKVGGLHYVYIGRFGFCWFWQRKRKAETISIAERKLAVNKALSEGRMF